jgi:serine/threonine protein kinase
MSGPKSNRDADSSPDARWTVPPADYVKPATSAARASALESGANDDAGLKKFGRYTLEKLLGQGAMGAVFLAHDPALDRKVALKIPKFSDEDEEDLRQRFYREARAAGNLRHPNICPVYDIGEHDGTLYITMAYLEGRPLSHYIDRDKPLDERDAAETTIKLARALQEAHDHGVIHRDLKPDNVIIDSKGEPIIMDFGSRKAACWWVPPRTCPPSKSSRSITSSDPRAISTVSVSCSTKCSRAACHSRVPSRSSSDKSSRRIPRARPSSGPTSIGSSKSFASR